MQKQKIDKFQFCHSNFAEHFEAQPPCSAYSVLTDAGVLQDPYFGEREEEARVLSDGDCWFTADFTPEASFMNCEHLLLCLNGIDTVSEIYLNGVFLGKTDNMHRRWEFDVRALLRPGENQLGIHIFSPTEYIRRRQEQHPLWSGKGLPVGMGHIRKSYCSFGWDWAPSLPDMGILGDVALEGFTGGRIENLTLTQRHTDEAAELVCAMVTSLLRRDHRIRPGRIADRLAARCKRTSGSPHYKAGALVAEWVRSTTALPFVCGCAEGWRGVRQM